MKKAKWILAAAVLAAVFLCTACGNTVYAVKSLPKREKDTPIAVIENDDYVPYSQREGASEEIEKEDVLRAAAEELNAQGEHIEVYASEQEYEAVKAARAAQYAHEVEAYDAPPVTEVRQVITVVTTPTGSKENGTYEASKPLPNAIVRIDGVPRFTDRQGQIKVTLSREYVELIVEKNDYNPYIEIMHVTGEEKTVRLKRETDDITVFAVMMEYEGERFNLLTQPCYLNTDLTMSLCEVTAECNVPVDSVDLFVNGERRITRPGNVIEDFQFTEYGRNDKFSLSVHYSGIQSVRYDLQLFVVNSQFSVASAQTYSNDTVSATIGDKDTPIGEVGMLNIPTGTINNFLKEKLNNRGTQWELNGINFETTYVYYPHDGTILHSVGFSVSLPVYSKTINHEQNKIREIEEEKAEYENKVAPYEEEMVRLKNEIDELEKSKEKRTETLNKYIKDRQEKIDALNKKYSETVNQDERKKIENELKRRKRNMSQNQRYHNKKFEEANKQIAQKRGDLNAIKQIKDAIPQPTKSLGKIFQAKTSDFGVDLELSVIGSQKYSADTKQIIDCRVQGEIELKFNYTFSFTLWVIPCFVSVDVSVGARAGIVLLNGNTGKVINEEQIKDYLELYFTFGLRLDLGVGIKKTAYVSGFGEAKFDLKVLPNRYGELTFRAGVKVKVFFFKREWAHRWDPITFGDDETQILSRSVTSRNLQNSANDIAQNLYACSNVRYIGLAENKYLIAWLEDSPARNDCNRTVLRYAVYQNGELGEVKDVYNDGKADFYFDMVSDGENVSLVWQKSNRIFTEEDGVAEMLQAGEVYAARFDTQTESFINIEQITDNEGMDATPVIAKKEKPSDPTTVVWERNSENDAFGTSGTNSLWYAQQTAQGWTQPRELFTTQKIVSAWDAAIHNGALTVAVVEDEDGDFCTADGALTVITPSGATRTPWKNIASAQFTAYNGQTELSYYADGYVYTTTDFAVSECLAIPQGIVPQDYTVTKNENGTVLTYQKLHEGGKQAFCAVQNAHGDWNYDILLTNETAKVYNSYGVCVGNNTVACLYAIEDEEENAALCFTKKEFVSSLAIQDVYSLEKMEHGQENLLYITVKNTGDTNLYALRMNENSDIDLSENPLRVGETRTVQCPFTPDFTQNEAQITLQAIENGKTLCADTFALNLRYADVQTEVKVHIFEGKQIFTATVTNSSYFATNVELKIYRNGEYVKSELFALSPRETKEVQISFANIEEGDYVFFNAHTELTDIYEGDNMAGVYSLQHEEPIVVRVNPYEEALRLARSLA